ncbi:MAG: HAMP domain-containing histidine kinase [Leptolyngbya sp. SIO4C1]|nr:HAMP domain-containing histidine kinase [Leptolyngbya sp. SIO4C1]
MVNQVLPTISSLVALGEFNPDACSDDCSSELDEPTKQSLNANERLLQQARKAEREWQGATAAARQLLERVLPQPAAPAAVQGLLLSGPFPVLDSPTQLSHWTFVPQPLEQLSLAFSQLMPAEGTCSARPASARVLPLIEGDPIAAERFCLLLTRAFGLVLVLGRDANSELHFQFSFTPAIVCSVWQLLRSRIVLTQPKQLEQLEPLIEQFAPVAPDYRLVSQFSRLLIANLPCVKAESDHQVERIREPRHRVQAAYARSAPKRRSTDGTVSTLDAELLKAMAHEIRTPLTTIRTFTRSLLRRQELDPNVIKRLKQIDRECTQQIDRFSLIFKAVELHSAAQKATLRSPLTATSLTQIFQESIPQWQQAAARRNLSLEVALPSTLPMVVSDPNLLQQVLTGLIELFTHSVVPSSHIQMQVMSAGHQLKLQFQSQSVASSTRASVAHAPALKQLGNLLMFQPETGGVSLNLSATKALFKALGAKLIVRDRPAQGTTWTVFLPIETANLERYPVV